MPCSRQAYAWQIIRRRREPLGTTLIGILETHQGKGIFVAQVPYALLLSRLRRLKDSTGDARALLDRIWEMREIVGVSVASLAARRRTDEDLSNMKHVVQAMDKAIENAGMGAEEDALFHHYLNPGRRDKQEASVLNLLWCAEPISRSPHTGPFADSEDFVRCLFAEALLTNLDPNPP